MTPLQCPNCTATIFPDDQFCEECGTPLVQLTPLYIEPAPSIGCYKCGAPLEAIDNEGYCSHCGFQTEQPKSDRLQITINSQFAGASDRGIKHHKNEDYLALNQINNTQILVVCDGVSSSSTPELAAQIAAKTTCEVLAQENPPEAAIHTAFAAALTAVSNIDYTENQDTEPPSTTIIAAVVAQNTATIGWLGDSRAYWISPNGSRLLTKDDSWVNEVVAAGEMTQTQAQQSPHAHSITRWLGADTRDDAKPSVIKFTIPNSGYLLLCSDGLWNYAPEAEALANLILPQPKQDVISISNHLVNYAISRGGRDNITVAILEIGSRGGLQTIVSKNEKSL